MIFEHSLITFRSSLHMEKIFFQYKFKIIKTKVVDFIFTTWHRVRGKKVSLLTVMYLCETRRCSTETLREIARFYFVRIVKKNTEKHRVLYSCS